MTHLNDLVTLAQAAKLAPGGAVAPVSVWRWAKQGILDPEGKRVKLTVFKAGARLCTTQEALVEFFAAAGGQNDPERMSN